MIPQRHLPTRADLRRKPLRHTRLRRRSARAEDEAALDAMLREYVMRRDGNRCRRCGRGPKPGRGGMLTTAHILPKGKYASARYLPENVIALCYGCHLEFAHKDPLGFVCWIEDTFRLSVVTRLHAIAACPGRVDRAMDRVRLTALLKGEA